MPKRGPRTNALAVHSGVMPPNKLAPPVAPPIEQARTSDTLAPWPLNDRYPFVLGQNLNLTVLASIFRLATTGYRQQYVDVLNELMELDPHLYAVLQKRILSVANSKVDIVAADVPEDDTDFKLSQEVAEMVRREVARIPDMSKVLASLLWGVYYGVAASEIFWSRDSDGWHPERIEFVHSRRLAYPDAQSWALHVWDQGQVYGWTYWGGQGEPTSGNVFGLRIADYPGKFIVHAPQLRGEYPTRDGVGRETAVWALLKRIGTRGGPDYLERFAKGFIDVTYSTANSDASRAIPREATQEDIEIAVSLAKAIGPGSGSFAVHPDSIKFEPKGYEGSGTAKLTWQEWIAICDAQMSKAVLGGTLGTDVSSNGGNRALGEVQERSEADIEKYDAASLGDTLKRDLVSWIVRLNKPEAMHLVPSVSVHMEVDPDPKSIMELIDRATLNGAPVDWDAMAPDLGLRLVPNESKDDEGKTKPRRAFRSDVVDPTAIDPDLLSEAAKQQAQDELEHNRQVELEKAKAPPFGGQVPQDGTTQQAAPEEPEKADEAKKPAGKAAPKAAKAGKGKANKAKPGKGKGGVKQLTDQVTLAVERDIESVHRRLLADRADGGAAQAVYDMLLEDYPASALGWILAAQWDGPFLVPTSDIDFSESNRWRATHEYAADPHALDHYVERAGTDKQKPVVLVQTPNKTLKDVVDGHHRTTAAELKGVPVLAYWAPVQVEDGPWTILHSLQIKGSSKTGPSYQEPPSYSAPDEIDQDA